MSRLFSTLLLVSAFAASSLAASSPLPFNDGESFEFRVAWGIFRGAGHLHVTARQEVKEGKPILRLTSQTRTAGVIRALYPFEAESECTFDRTEGKLLTASAVSRSPNKETRALATVDYVGAKVRYEDAIDQSRSEDLPLPSGQPMDMITTLLASRHWKLQPGESREVVVMFDKDFYELRIVAERIETLETDQGPVEALVLSPKMEKNPRGMFRRGGQVQVWVTHDERRLPLRLKVSLKVGTGTAYLTRYDPGLLTEGAPLALRHE